MSRLVPPKPYYSEYLFISTCIESAVHRTLTALHPKSLISCDQRRRNPSLLHTSLSWSNCTVIINFIYCFTEERFSSLCRSAVNLQLFDTSSILETPILRFSPLEIIGAPVNWCQFFSHGLTNLPKCENYHREGKERKDGNFCFFI